MRWNNYGLWVALGALITMILTDAFQIAAEDTQRYLDVILGLLIAAGIVTDPVRGKGFNVSDKK